MSSLLEEAKVYLKIRSVRIESCAAWVNDDIEFERLHFDESEIQRTSGPLKIKRIHAETASGNWYEYNFYYMAGIRKIIPNNKRDGEIEKADILMEIKATFCAVYRSTKQLEGETLLAFAEKNLGYHVWPYWREYVHSSCGRLSLENLEIPHYFCEEQVGDSSED